MASSLAAASTGTSCESIGKGAAVEDCSQVKHILRCLWQLEVQVQHIKVQVQVQKLRTAVRYSMSGIVSVSWG